MAADRAALCGSQRKCRLGFQKRDYKLLRRLLTGANPAFCETWLAANAPHQKRSGQTTIWLSQFVLRNSGKTAASRISRLAGRATATSPHKALLSNAQYHISVNPLYGVVNRFGPLAAIVRKRQGLKITEASGTRLGYSVRCPASEWYPLQKTTGFLLTQLTSSG
jgi:hypothetical protein